MKRDDFEDIEGIDYLSLVARRKFVIIIFFLVFFTISFFYFYQVYKKYPLLYKISFTIKLEPVLTKKGGENVLVITQRNNSKRFASFIALDYIVNKAVAMTFPNESEDRLIELGSKIREKMNIDINEDNINVSVLGKDPDKLFNFCNNWLEVITEERDKEKNKLMRKNIEVLKEQLAQAKKELEKAKEELTEFVLNNETLVGILKMVSRQGGIERDISPELISSIYINIKAEREKLGEEIQEIERILDNGSYVDAYKFILRIEKNLVSRNLLDELEEKKKELDQLLLVNREAHPTVIRAQQELSQIENNIKEEVERVLSYLKWKRDDKAKQEKEINELIKKGGAKTVLYYQKLVKRNDETRRRCDSIYKELDSLKMAQLLSQGPDFSIIEYPKRPYSPVNMDAKKRKKMFGIIYALFIGIIGGLGVGALVDHFDASIHTIEDIEELGLLVLSVIPFSKAIKNKGKNISVLQDRRSLVNDSFRSLRVNLKFSITNQEKNAIAITSSLPQEGKTFISAHLATVFANAGSKTLLIDGDIINPQIHKYFNFPNRRGFINMIEGTTEDDPIYSTPIHNLWFIPAGIFSQKTEFIKEDRLRQIVADLKKEFDWVIIDTPPFSHITGESLVITRQADYAILVARAMRTLKRIFLRTKNSMDNFGISILGTVINGMPIRKGYGYYHYYKKYDKGY